MGKNGFQKFAERFNFEQLCVRFISSWLVACIFSILYSKVGFFTLEFASGVNILLFAATCLCSFLLFTLIDRLSRANSDAWALGITALLYALQMIIRRRDFYLSLGIIFVLSIIGYYLLKDDKLGLGKIKFSKGAVIGIIVSAGVFFVLYVGGLTVLRYLNYGTSTYDFGIFSQMFYQMKETFLPNTTCERNGMLSHFAVHLSPIYYLLLPVYWIFPSPICLQLAQAVVVASGIIPLYLLARHFSLSEKISAIVCVVYALYPALAGSCFYDIHENMFLTPLLLWMFYFSEKQKWHFMYLFAFLVCLVKEDAPIYVACFALFLLFSRKKALHGSILFAGAVVYFCAAMMILKSFGQGAMINRYDNFIADPNAGLLSMFKTLFFDPAYLVSEIFNQEKLQYILTMLIPLACLPLLSRNLSQFFLLIPFLVVNLMSDYKYQHSVVFQYNFGSIAFLFFLVVMNLSDLGPKFRRYAVPFMTVAATIMFVFSVGVYADNVSRYVKNYKECQKLDAYLEAIPEDADVQATGYMVPKLSNRMVIYDYHFNQDSDDPHETEYIVFDLRLGREKDAEESVVKEIENGYETVVYDENLVAILRNPEYAKK